MEYSFIDADADADDDPDIDGIVQYIYIYIYIHWMVQSIFVIHGGKGKSVVLLE